MALTLHISAAAPWWSRWRPTVHYLVETEAHVYALAISASVLLAFFPFLIVMISLCRDTLHSPGAQQAIYTAVSDFFAGEQGQFLVRNLRSIGPPKLHFTAMFLLLLTANGIFEPLEVALNRAWGVTQNRSYLKNQLVSLGLIFACGALALLSLMLTSFNTRWIADATGGHAEAAAWIKLAFFKLAALPVSIFALFLVYWVLPNRPIEPGRVLPVAIAVGVALEALKYVYIVIEPMLTEKLAREYYTVFQHSAMILIWSFVCAMVVLAGAHWTARQDQRDPLE